MHPLFLSHTLVSDLNLPRPYPRIALSGPEAGVRDAGMLYVHLAISCPTRQRSTNYIFRWRKFQGRALRTVLKSKLFPVKKKKKVYIFHLRLSEGRN